MPIAKPITDAHETMTAASGLAKRVRDLAAKLVGHGTGDHDPCGEIEACASGLFDQLRDHANDAAADIRMAHAALDRIESALPCRNVADSGQG